MNANQKTDSDYQTWYCSVSIIWTKFIPIIISLIVFKNELQKST